jgi:hypothetical protein
MTSTQNRETVLLDARDKLIDWLMADAEIRLIPEGECGRRYSVVLQIDATARELIDAMTYADHFEAQLADLMRAAGESGDILFKRRDDRLIREARALTVTSRGGDGPERVTGNRGKAA